VPQNKECALTQAIASADTSRNLLIVAGAGLLSGILTPLLPTLLDKIAGVPADVRLALVAIPLPFWSSSWFAASASIRCGRRCWRLSSRW